MGAQFRLDYALSREQTNTRGGKMYIQDKVEEYADEVFDLLDNGAHIYFCGLKGMMPGAPPLPCAATESGAAFVSCRRHLCMLRAWLRAWLPCPLYPAKTSMQEGRTGTS